MNKQKGRGNMKIGIQIESELLWYGEEGALKMAAEAGFDAIDYSLHPQTDPYTCLLATGTEEEVFAHYAKLGAYAKRLGLSITQTHAPLAHNYVPEEIEYNRNMLAMQLNSIPATAALGAKYEVVHVVQPPLTRWSEEYQAFGESLNVEFFRKLLPLLRKYDVKVAIENLFGITTLPTDDYDYSLNSRTSEMLRVINLLNDMAGEERFVACVDTGHALVMGQDPAEMIRALGSRVKVLHIDDNDGKHDFHYPPYLGKTNWSDVLAALKEIGFDGSFNFEVYPFYGGHTPDCTFEAMRFLYMLGHRMTMEAGL